MPRMRMTATAMIQMLAPTVTRTLSARPGPGCLFGIHTLRTGKQAGPLGGGTPLAGSGTTPMRGPCAPLGSAGAEGFSYATVPGCVAPDHPVTLRREDLVPLGISPVPHSVHACALSASRHRDRTEPQGHEVDGSLVVPVRLGRVPHRHPFLAVGRTQGCTPLQLHRDPQRADS